MRLSTVTDNELGGANNTTTYTYDAANNLATAAYPNGIQESFQYDSLNRLTTMASAVSGYGYNLGPTGIRTGATELTGRSVTWSFDGIYRLTGETVRILPVRPVRSPSFLLQKLNASPTDTSG